MVFPKFRKKCIKLVFCVDNSDKVALSVRFGRIVMKTTTGFIAPFLVVLALALGILVLSGCASTQNRDSSDSQTMSDFIGGGKPEFNGNKY